LKIFGSALICLLLFAALTALTYAEDQIPTGFKLERYKRLFERNPFTQVEPRAPESNPSPFEKLFLTSWLKDDGKFVIFVQNSDTNEVQRITSEANQDSWRLVEMHLNPNPALVEAIVCTRTQKGAVKFRVEQPSVEPASSGTAQTGHIGSTSSASNPGPSKLLPRSPGGFGNAQNPAVPGAPRVDQTVPQRFNPVIRGVPGEDQPAPARGGQASG
jgi:hypothetical protein